jgi:hypothetical protein
MPEKLELIDPSEVTDQEIEEHGKPYRPGTSFGYCHVPVEIIDAPISNEAKLAFLRLLIADSLGQEIPEQEVDFGFFIGSPRDEKEPEIFEKIAFDFGSRIRRELETAGMISTGCIDSDDCPELIFQINEPEDWKK